MTTTPTSGAAIQRYKIGYHADERAQRSSTPSVIPEASGSWVRYEDHIAALAAGQATAAPAQPAAQQGVAYAALPDEVVRLAQVAIRECQYKGNDMPQDWMESAMRACRLIAASHGQAPAGAVPLTRNQVKAILVESGYYNADAQHKSHFMNGIRHGEAAHGIKHGGQHGAE